MATTSVAIEDVKDVENTFKTRNDYKSVIEIYKGRELDTGSTVECGSKVAIHELVGAPTISEYFDKHKGFVYFTFTAKQTKDNKVQELIDKGTKPAKATITLVVGNKTSTISFPDAFVSSEGRKEDDSDLLYFSIGVNPRQSAIDVKNPTGSVQQLDGSKLECNGKPVHRDALAKLG